MSMMIGSSNSNVTRITLKNPDGSVAGSIGFTKSKKTQKSSTKKKKPLYYNFKQISAQILATKTSSSASLIVAKARRQRVAMQMKLKLGEHDDQELERAIAHAQRMELVARKRMKHLIEEGRVQRGQNISLSDLTVELDVQMPEEPDMEDFLSQSAEELENLIQELQESIEDTVSEMDAATPEDRLSEVLDASIDVLDLQNLKKKHRAEELREIMEADMKYLKALFDQLAKEQQSTAASGVSLQLDGVEVPVETVEAPVPVEGGAIDVSV